MENNSTEVRKKVARYSDHRYCYIEIQSYPAKVVTYVRLMQMLKKDFPYIDENTVDSHELMGGLISVGVKIPKGKRVPNDYYRVN